MKRIKITVTSLLSLMLISSSLISCDNEGGDTSNNEINKGYFQNAKATENSWFDFVNNNYEFVQNSFIKGVDQRNLDVMLEQLGYERGALTIDQFNKIYKEIVNMQNQAELNFEDVYNHYYSDRPEYFKEILSTILSNHTIDSRIGEPQWSQLSFEDQNLLKGLNELIKKYPKNDRLQAKGMSASGTFFSGVVNLGPEAGVIGFYTMVGAGIGGIIGGLPGAGIGAAAGAVVGVVAAVLK